MAKKRDSGCWLGFLIILAVISVALVISWKLDLLGRWALGLSGLLVLLLLKGIRAYRSAIKMEAVASRLGFQFRKKIDLRSETDYDLDSFPIPFVTLDSDSPVYTVSNYMSGRKNETDVSVFTFTHFIGEASVTELAIVLSGLGGRVPAFELSPEDFWTRERGRNIRDINFDEHPEFSKSYTLHGDDPESVRELFSGHVAHYFARNRKLQRIWVRDDVLLVRESTARVEDIEYLLSTALYIKTLLESATSQASRRDRSVTPPGKLRDPRTSAVPALADRGVRPQKTRARFFMENLPATGLVASVFWGLGAFVWYSVGLRDGGIFIVLSGLAGIAVLVTGFLRPPLTREEVLEEKREEMNPDKYAPWKNYEV